MDWGSFWAGYAIGNAQWGAIDGFVAYMVYTLLWPWRPLLTDRENIESARKWMRYGRE